MPPLADVVAEAERLVQLAGSRGVPLKLVGGLGVRAVAPSSRAAPLARAYKDLDLAIPFRARPAALELMAEAGYVENKAFNTLNGHQRLMFGDPAHQRQVDVFVDQMHLCHVIDLRNRFGLAGPALPAADLLLSKLQIVEMTRKDLLDVAALLADLPLAEKDEDGINQAYLGKLAGDDWGLWRTITLSLEKVKAFVAEELAGWEGGAAVAAKAAALAGALEQAPKSLKWRMRAVVGEKVRWYELPEERA